MQKRVGDIEAATYVPLLLKSLQIHKLPPHALIAQIAAILLQKPATGFRVLGLGYGILDVGFLKTVKGDDDTVDFGKRVVQIALFGGELDFLCDRINFAGNERGRGREGETSTSSRLIVAAREGLGT